MDELKTAETMLTDIWRTPSNKSNNINLLTLPPRREWQYKEEIKFADVSLWEEIYHQPGNFGIYAAWDPYAEFYVIVHYLFKDEQWGIQKFYGADASTKVLQEAALYGVDLPTTNIWISDAESQLRRS